jgi:ribosomal protein L22
LNTILHIKIIIYVKPSISKSSSEIYSNVSHKIRRVLDQIRVVILRSANDFRILPYDAGGPIWQVVHSAAANAKHNYGLDKKINN